MTIYHMIPDVSLILLFFLIKIYVNVNAKMQKCSIHILNIFLKTFIIKMLSTNFRLSQKNLRLRKTNLKVEFRKSVI